MMVADQDYGVRVLRAYSNMTVGRVIFPAGVEREMLLRRGWVEKMEAPEKSPKRGKREA